MRSWCNPSRWSGSACSVRFNLDIAARMSSARQIWTAFLEPSRNSWQLPREKVRHVCSAHVPRLTFLSCFRDSGRLAQACAVPAKGLREVCRPWPTRLDLAACVSPPPRFDPLVPVLRPGSSGEPPPGSCDTCARVSTRSSFSPRPLTFLPLQALTWSATVDSAVLPPARFALPSPVLRGGILSDAQVSGWFGF